MKTSYSNSAPGLKSTSSNSRTIPWVIAIITLLTICCCGSLLAIMVGSESSIEGFFVGLFLAFFPVPFYILLALWIDRYEPEPAWMLGAAFIWGAVVSTAFSLVLNTASGLVVGLLAGMDVGDVFMSVISAPIVEETFKGLAVLIFFLWRKSEFDNIIDGILYAALIGLGFAMTENVIYYARAFAEEGLAGSTSLFFLRGVALPFLHPLCTSLTGIGFGYARQRNKGSLRYIAPVIGLILAITLHGIWNLSATLGGWLIAYVVVLIPTLIGVLILAQINRKKESNILRDYLLTDVNAGRLNQEEYLAMFQLKTRTKLLWTELFSRGVSAFIRLSKFYQLGGELAFHRWRVARGITPYDEMSVSREAEYLNGMGRPL